MKHPDLLDPWRFPKGSFIKSFYSGKVYLITEFKQGIAFLKHITTGRIEPFNECSNPHFIKAHQQLELWS